MPSGARETSLGSNQWSAIQLPWNPSGILAGRCTRSPERVSLRYEEFVPQGHALRLEKLEDGGVGLAAALAHGLQAVPGAGRLHVVDQGGHDPGAAAAERVTEGDRAAVR